MEASVDCRSEVTSETARALLELMDGFARSGPSEEELAVSKSFQLGSFAVSRETPGSLVQDEVARVVLGLPEEEWRTWRDRVAAVTLDEVRAVARSLFDPGPASS